MWQLDSDALPFSGACSHDDISHSVTIGSSSTGYGCTCSSGYDWLAQLCIVEPHMQHRYAISLAIPESRSLISLELLQFSAFHSRSPLSFFVSYVVHQSFYTSMKPCRTTNFLERRCDNCLLLFPLSWAYFVCSYPDLPEQDYWSVSLACVTEGSQALAVSIAVICSSFRYPYIANLRKLSALQYHRWYFLTCGGPFIFFVYPEWCLAFGSLSVHSYLWVPNRSS